MSRVDFYVLKGSGDPTRNHFACRLAEKAYRQENTVHIQVASDAAARQLDELLWTFRDGSFLPHEVVDGTAESAESPITVGLTSAPSSTPDLLINLSDAVPANADAFQRIAEIVTADEPSKTRSRQQFVSYRDAGHQLESHQI